jgi:2-methylisocitrate lyase-like PEP mutase family enzyme
VNELSRIGAKRISVGGALTRIAFAALLGAAREMKEHGTFSFVNGPITSREIAALISSAS